MKKPKTIAFDPLDRPLIPLLPPDLLVEAAQALTNCLFWAGDHIYKNPRKPTKSKPRRRPARKK